MSSDEPRFIPFRSAAIPTEAGLERGERLYAELDTRRSVRFFSDAPVPRAMIETAIRTASTAPSGAHMQPWTFVAISDPEVKRRIRLAAEREEHALYEEGRISEEWREALEPLGTTWEKPFLETVPWIVVLFAQRSGLHPDGSKRKHYYVSESVGIAAGLFIASLHRMGLATLTHTPSPMGFLSELLGRPARESPTILFPIGYPSEDCVVPNLKRKELHEVSEWFEG